MRAKPRYDGNAEWYEARFAGYARDDGSSATHLRRLLEPGRPRTSTRTSTISSPSSPTSSGSSVLVDASSTSARIPASWGPSSSCWMTRRKSFTPAIAMPVGAKTLRTSPTSAAGVAWGTPTCRWPNSSRRSHPVARLGTPPFTSSAPPARTTRSQRPCRSSPLPRRFASA
jgi:hypothetical protein